MVDVPSISTLTVFVNTWQETTRVRGWILRSMRWKEHLVPASSVSLFCIVTSAVCLLPPDLRHYFVIWNTPLIVLFSLLLLTTWLQASVTCCSTSCNWCITTVVRFVLMLKRIAPLISVACCNCYAIPSCADDSFLNILILWSDLIIYLCFVFINAL